MIQEFIEGKVHNIETIQNKREQNIYGVVYHLNHADIKPSADNPNLMVVRFTIPVLIHSTVLPPQKNADYVDTGIPQNAKVYINFLKANASQLLTGRFSSDCLFEGSSENFVAIGSMDDNVSNRILEQRITLNFAYYNVTTFLTAAFSVIGLLVYFKIIIRAFHDSYFNNKDSHVPMKCSRPHLDSEDTKKLLNSSTKLKQD